MGSPAESRTGPDQTRPAALFLARRLRDAIGVPVVLAGGLRPETVRAAIDEVGPYGVDVISGVEGAGHRKDPAKVAALVVAVRGQQGVASVGDGRSPRDG